MPNLPAICPNGHVYPSGLFVENVRELSIEKYNVQCPFCGQMGMVPNGLYNIIENSINFLRGHNVSRQTLAKLKKILEDGRRDKNDSQAIQSKINKETPELQSLADILPKTRNELYAFISMLLALITILVTLNSSEREPNEIINVINNNYITINNAKNSPNSASTIDSNVPKVSRNELCPCSSGRKYKRCHGRNSILFP